MRARAGLAALVLLVLPAAPALAQRTANARVDAPAGNSILTGTVAVRGVGESVAGVKSVEVLVNSWSVAVKQPRDFERSVHAEYSWDTTRWPSDGTPAPNGTYTILVQATSLDGDTDKATTEIVTDNPPVVPADPAVKERGGRVKVSWAPNPEPDILGYVVERDEGRGFLEIGTTTTTKIKQNLVPGEYSYRVTAVRSSSVSEDGTISSAPSAVAGVTVTASSAGGSGAVTDLGGRGGSAGGRNRLGSGGTTNLGALLSNSSLPDQRGLPPIPSPPGIPWGDYEETLPYGKDAVPPPGSSALTSARRGGGSTLLPADGLRWVAAGMLLLACAGLALVTAARDVALLARGRGPDSRG